jgi:hypothetical protein
MPVTTFSFASDYSKTPLIVHHGLPEEPLGQYAIENIWTVEHLLESADNAQPTPKNWDEALTRLITSFSSLKISAEVYQQMAAVPYSAGVFNSLYERCKILADYLSSRDENGQLTEHSHTLLRDHFQGDKAWFSASSNQEIIDFKHQLSFTDLFDGKKTIFAFHGKIKTPQIRIHFEWPIAPSTKVIQIVYIGPKTTKR